MDPEHDIHQRPKKPQKPGKVVGAEKLEFAWLKLTELLHCVNTPRGTYFYNSR